MKQKRICFLLNNEFTHDNRVKREATALIQAGYEVRLIAFQPKNSQLPDYEVMEGIHIHRLFDKPLFNYDFFNRRNIAFIWKILRQFKRFDVIHAHDANTLFIGWALARLMRTRLVYDSHEYWTSYYEEERKRLNKQAGQMGPAACRRAFKNLRQAERFEAWALQQSDAVISVSDSLVQLLQEKTNHKLKRALTLRNICEFQNVTKGKRFHEEFQLPPDAQIILYQGGITEIRGIMRLLQMMEKLQTPNVYLVLMGRTNAAFFRKMTARIQKSSVLRPRILFKQMVPPEELLSWSASADLGIHPILDCRTNHHICLPNKVFEYIQAEIPMALATVPEMKRIVETYQTGFAIDPENPVDMAARIDAFFADPVQQEHFRHQARLAKQELSWEQEQGKLVSLYQSILEDDKQPLLFEAPVQNRQVAQ